MIPPAESARRLLWALAVGAALGLLYGLLRPFRRKLPQLWDAVFVLAAFRGWLYVSFAVCGGDLRFGCTAAMAIGALGWEMSVGRLLRPFFRRLRDALGALLALVAAPGKNFFKKMRKIAIFLLASGKKWFTIKPKRQKQTARSGGEGHERNQNTRQTGNSKIQPGHEGGPAGGSGAVHCGSGGAARLHRGQSGAI